MTDQPEGVLQKIWFWRVKHIHRKMGWTKEAIESICWADIAEYYHEGMSPSRAVSESLGYSSDFMEVHHD